MSRLLSVSIPDDLAGALDSLVQGTGKTKSEVVRDALRRQVQLGRLTDLQAYGRELAEARGIGPEDSEVLVDELRTQQR
jgi:Arc/MetJ-type ribon-helix-helix transcriptional regulator